MANEKRLIDANEAYEIARFHHKDFAQSMADLTSLREVLEDANTVEAVEVVRCKDCVHRKERVCMMPYAGMWAGVELKDDDFCSYGERKDNG